MIFNFNNMDFSDDDWKYIILQYLKEWTEIPLNPTYGYDIEELKFFDGFLGTLLKQTESLTLKQEKNAKHSLQSL